MIRLIVLMFLSFLFHPAISQNSFESPVNSTHNFNGTVLGKVTEKSSHNLVEGASVQLIQINTDRQHQNLVEIIIALVITNKKGEFFINKIAEAGNYKILIIEKGFKLFEKLFTLSHEKPVSDIGTIELTADDITLDTVSVNSAKSLIQLSLDKKIYNVEGDLAAANGTTLDVLKNVPGVLVDIDGNIFLRNAEPQILIDGRPSTVSPGQLPANQVAFIEIITNPSARYNAGSGSAGIINIVMKKNKRKGGNGTLRTGINSRGKSSFGGDINILQTKLNLFASLNVNGFKTITNTETQRSEPLSTGKLFVQQNNKPSVNGTYTFSRAGMDYFIDKRNTISLSGNYFKAIFHAKDLIFISRDSLYPGFSSSEKSQRDVKVDADLTNTGSSAGYKHLFSKEGKEFTADLNYNLSRYKNTSNYLSRFYEANGNLKPYTNGERATGGFETQGYVIQTNFLNPINSTDKVETGLRFDLHDYTSWNDNYLKNVATGNYELLYDLSVNYDYKEKIFAGYGIYSEQIKKFSYQLGLRMESSQYQGKLRNKNQEFKNNYPVSFFPSIYLSQKLNEKEDIQLNFSRKIYRPVFFQLAPFVDYSDSLNIFRGSPSLKPEFTNLTEFSYSKEFKPGHSILASAYLNFTNDIITRYQYKAANTNPAINDSVVYNSYINANKNYVSGIEFTSINTLFKWWKINSSLNVYNVNLKADNIAGTSDNQLTSWFAKINNNFQLPEKISLQVNADYQSRTILPSSSRSNSGLLGNTQFNAQGEIKPTYGVDLSVRKSFFKNNAASAALLWNDIFSTRSYRLNSSSDFYSQQVYRLRDPQVLHLTFTWQFGKIDANIFKRRSAKGEKETMNSIQGALGQ